MSARHALGRDLRTTAIAVVAASVVAGPSAAVAAYVANADKVDNKHAVGAGAAVSKRKGKLVATSGTTGLLPNNIIAKALDADRLDGLDSSAFLPASGTAADSGLLDGLDSSAFLPSGGKAADADQLDGLDSTELLPRQVTTQTGDPDTTPQVSLTETVDDVAQVSITVPGPGRIQVDGTSVVMARPSSTSYSFATLSISEVPDAHDPSAAGRSLWDVPAVEALDGLFRTTLPTTRTFEVGAAGTYTYYLVGDGSADDAESADGPLHYSSQVTAQYVPTP